MLNIGYAIATLGLAAMATSYVFAGDWPGLLPWALAFGLTALNWALHNALILQQGVIDRLTADLERADAVNGSR